MYSRRLDGKILAFGHEGILYKQSFLMYDRGTKSLWVHTTGQAIKGKMSGKVLKFLPSRITTWKAWKTTFPETKVLIGARAGRFTGSFTARKRPNQFGLSVGSGLETKLYPFPTLIKKPLLTDRFRGKEILITFDLDKATAAAYELGDKPRRFELQGSGSDGRTVMIDQGTQSRWDAFTGRCFEGKLKGEKLKAIPATAWLSHRWHGFFPDGEIYR